jgi:hypothetical protein
MSEAQKLVLVRSGALPGFQRDMRGKKFDTVNELLQEVKEWEALGNLSDLQWAQNLGSPVGVEVTKKEKEDKTDKWVGVLKELAEGMKLGLACFLLNVAILVVRAPCLPCIREVPGLILVAGYPGSCDVFCIECI